MVAKKINTRTAVGLPFNPAPAKPKKLTAKQKVTVLTALVQEMQLAYFHEPDSDAMQYCNGCHRSPYNMMGPHAEGCLVVKVQRTLREVGGTCPDCGQSVASHKEWCENHPRRVKVAAEKR